MVLGKQPVALFGGNDDIAMAIVERQFDVIGHPATQSVFDDQAVDDDIDVMAFVLVEGRHFVDEHCLPIDAKPSKPLLLEFFDRRGMGALFMANDRRKDADP